MAGYGKKNFMWLFVIVLVFTASFRGLYGADEGFTDFVKVDDESGLFRNAMGCFPILSVTYVQPTQGSPGYNSGPWRIYHFDLTKFREDFRQMHELGINGIYMRVNAGFFLDPNSQWRTLESDPNFALSVNALERQEKVGPFTYFYEVFDYLLDCARQEEIYVAMTIMDLWSLPMTREPIIQENAILSDSDWQNIVAEWSKIAAKYKTQKALLGYFLEGEMMHFMTFNDYYPFFMGPLGQRPEPVMSALETKDKDLTQRFQRFLKRYYGDVENLKTQWRYGYDRRSSPYDANAGVPQYAYKKGVYDDIHDFSDVELPAVERSGKDKAIGWPGLDWSQVPFDPVWIDFTYFREELYTARLNQLIKSIRNADQNHLIIYSASQDDVPVWHTFHTLWNKGQLDADVMLHGAGYVDFHWDPNNLKIKKYETAKELHQSVGPFRAFATSGTCKAKVFGMGEGGFQIESSNPLSKIRDVSEQAEDRWLTQLLMDNYGSGSGFVNLWDWGAITGSTVANSSLHSHDVTQTMQAIMRSLQVDTFTKNRQATILILANGNTLHSLIKPVCYNNIMVLSNILTSLHYRFDMVSTDEISWGPAVGKVDINKYDAIFMPELTQVPMKQFGDDITFDASGNVWKILRDWIDARPNRSLCVGLLGMRDSRLGPTTELPAEMLSLIGPIQTVPAQGEKFNRTCRLDGVDDVDIISGDIPVGRILVKPNEPSVASFLADGDDTIGVRHLLANGSRVYYFSFPLGMSGLSSWEQMLAGKPSGINFDDKSLSGLAKVYKRVLEKSGLYPFYSADASITAYISDDAKVIFLRQRNPVDNEAEEGSVSSPVLANHIYADATTTISRKGDDLAGTVTSKLNANLARVVTSIGNVKMIKDGTIKVTTAAVVGQDGTTKYRMTIQGDAASAKIDGDKCILPN